jgi:hypothetical protein
MKPRARTQYCPDPKYLRELVKLADVTQEQAADLLGVSPRTMRAYLSTSTDPNVHQDAPYCVQFALEALAGGDRTRDTALDAVRMVGAICKAHGGEIRIPRGALEELAMTEELERTDDPATGDIVYRLFAPGSPSCG